MAARFRFRLESLLKLRHSLEQVAQRNLAKALAQLDQARARVAELLRSQLETVALRSIGDHQVVDLEQWRAIERYLLVLELRLTVAQQQVREAETGVAAARRALMEAHRAHLMLVRLKERRQELHALELLREEARDMDEMAVLRYRIGPASQPREVQQ